jgi:hypothetical protein
MRRVGKTTALRYLLDKTLHDNKLYLDLERLEDRAIFTQNNFSEIQKDLEIKVINFTKPSLIALDEIQLVPDVASFIKYYHDHFPVKFLASGSSSYYLKNRFSESLAGRKRVFELFPLDFPEFLHFRNVDAEPLRSFRLYPYRRSLYAQYKPHYEEFIQFGGFPEVVLADSELKKKQFLKDVLNSYVELDVKLLADYTLIDDLYKLVSLLASRIGSKLDYSKIGSLLGINRHKVRNYIHLLERTYFLHLVQPYSGSIDRAIALQQKIYLADTGLVNQLARIDSGSLFENAVAVQLLKTHEINYFQLKSGQEIDFIIDKKIAIEVKETPTPRDLRILKDRASLLDLDELILAGRYPPGSDFLEFTWGGTIF